jgi:hypothetical protein
MTARPKQAAPDFAKQLEGATAGSGIAYVGSGNRKFVIVELDLDPASAHDPQGIYRVTDPDEKADLLDALDDTDNPEMTPEQVLQYLRSERARAAANF